MTEIRLAKTATFSTTSTHTPSNWKTVNSRQFHQGAIMSNQFRMRFLLVSILLVLGLASLAAAWPTQARVAAPPSDSSIPAAAVLNPDGTLNLHQAGNASVEL